MLSEDEIDNVKKARTDSRLGIHPESCSERSREVGLVNSADDYPPSIYIGGFGLYKLRKGLPTPFFKLISTLRAAATRYTGTTNGIT
jgi:hypothetical protein